MKTPRVVSECVIKPLAVKTAHPNRTSDIIIHARRDAHNARAAQMNEPCALLGSRERGE